MKIWIKNFNVTIMSDIRSFNTSFTLNMEDIGSTGGEGTCYNGTITDSTDCDFGLNGAWVDLYTFNNGVEAASNTSVASVADIQALYDPVTTLSTYLSSPMGATYTYLGNGDLVNFPVVPAVRLRPR